MQPVIVCRSCGRTIDKEYIYCPWCGTALAAPDEGAEFIQTALDRLAPIQQKGCYGRIDRMETTLQQMEADLSLFIS
ncbi:MAG: zinc ribbon domain-containing protein, partial [Spirochaetaceae bacterium]|nr:zinc ribbon domain-containing protein [Spirochaetaceae bacterium]